MRHVLIHERRRRKIVLFILLILVCFIWVQANIENIRLKIEEFIAEKIGRTFAGQVTIGRIEGGMLQTLILKDLVFKKDLAGGEVVLEIEEVIVGNDWQVLARSISSYIRAPFMLVGGGNVWGNPLGNMLERGPWVFDIANGRLILPNNAEPLVTNLRGRIVIVGDTIICDHLEGVVKGAIVEVDGNINTAKPVSFEGEVNARLERLDVAVELSGPFENLSIKGSASGLGKFNTDFIGRLGIANDRLLIRDFVIAERWPLEGEINLAERRLVFTLKLDEGELRLSGALSSNDQLTAICELGHIKLRTLDIASRIELKGNLEREETKIVGINGKIRTYNSVINYEPFEETEIFYHLSKGLIEILSLRLGRDVELCGSIGSVEPYFLDLLLKIQEVDPRRIFVWVKDEKTLNLMPNCMSGRFRIKGAARQADVDGYLTLREGYFGTVDYETANMKIKGKGSKLSIADSRFDRKEGYLVMEGDLDLAQGAQRNLFEKIKVKTDKENIIWEGWDITKKKGTDDLQLGKDVGKDFRINFKTFINEETKFEEQEAGGLELEYKIKSEDKLKMQLKQNDEFFGVEHKKKF